jgi:hypothetical protein
MIAEHNDNSAMPLLVIAGRMATFVSFSSGMKP